MTAGVCDPQVLPGERVPGAATPSVLVAHLPRPHMEGDPSERSILAFSHPAVLSRSSNSLTRTLCDDSRPLHLGLMSFLAHCPLSFSCQPVLSFPCKQSISLGRAMASPLFPPPPLFISPVRSPCSNFFHSSLLSLSCLRMERSAADDKVPAQRSPNRCVEHGNTSFLTLRPTVPMIPFARGACAPPPSDPTDALRAAVAAGRHLSPVPALRPVFLDGDAGAAPIAAAMRRRCRRSPRAKYSLSSCPGRLGRRCERDFGGQGETRIMSVCRPLMIKFLRNAV
jgi:hypothetical protein